VVASQRWAAERLQWQVRSGRVGGGDVTVVTMKRLVENDDMVGSGYNPVVGSKEAMQ
jgi:hypothetical protein